MGVGRWIDGRVQTAIIQTQQQQDDHVRSNRQSGDARRERASILDTPGDMLSPGVGFYSVFEIV